MRRLGIEGSVTNMMSVFLAPELQSAKSFEILHFLNQEPAEISFIARVEFSDPNINKRQFFAGFQEAQLLEEEKSGIIQIYYLKKKPMEEHLLDTGGFIVPPYAIQGGIVRFVFIGNNKQVDRFLATIESTGVQYKIISIGDAKFTFDSPLNVLTEKQRNALIVALDSGYFDVPSRINSEQLAKKLCIHHSALNVHLRKAERRLLVQLLKT
jgi:predicted DNA binding protein